VAETPKIAPAPSRPQRTPSAYAAELDSVTDRARAVLVVTESDTSYHANCDQQKPASVPIVAVVAVSLRLCSIRSLLRSIRSLRLRSIRITLAQTCQPILRGEGRNRVRRDGRKAARPEIHLSRAAICRQYPRPRGNAGAGARSQNPCASSERHVAAHAGNRTIPSAPTELISRCG